MISGWIGVDLDGTLAKHYWPQDGPYDPRRIGDPVPRMVERIKVWRAKAIGVEVRIFTARVAAHDPDAHPSVEQMVELIQDWTEEHIGARLPVTNTKDYMMLELWDDRAVRVVCDTGEPCCDLK